MSHPTGEPALSPNGRPSAKASPQKVCAPLSCWLPLQAPSCNSLLTMYCVGGKPKLETKAEVRLFRMQMKSKLPRWQCPKDGLLTLTLRFHQCWYHKAGSLKRQDAPNLIKCCLDCLAERYGFCDSRVWELCCEKVESSQVGIEVYLAEYQEATL